MWNIVWLIFAACSVALAVNSAIKPSGKLTITPNVIDLNSNVTFYTVSCQLDFVQDGWNSSSLVIKQRNEEIASKIINERTIIVRERIIGRSAAAPEKPPSCGYRKYLCYGNGFGLDVGSVSIGWKPVEIFPGEIKCISENLVGLRCEIPIKRPCDLITNYSMSMNFRFANSVCYVTVAGGIVIFDSTVENQTCTYRNGVEILRFDLNVSNNIGSRAMSFELNNFDLVRPAPVSRLQVINVTSRDLEVRWMEDISLNHLNRDFQYQFMLISEYGNNSSFDKKVSKMIYRFPMDKLQPYTNYTLKVRLRLVPKTPRAFEEDYWSEWSTVSFKTLPSKPDRAPKTVPGAFSIANRKGDVATIEIYWEHVPEYLHNGPGFGYHVVAESDTKQIFYPVQKSSVVPMATFANMPIAHYRITVSCYNDLGFAEDHNELEVFPTNPSQQPKIKKVLNADLFEVSWYPPTHRQDLISYTVMYCNFISSNACQNSIQFAVLPPKNTSFKVSSSSTLNFAVSANFANGSSPLSWQRCIVSPLDAVGIGAPRLEIVDLRRDSFVVTFDSDCIERSFYEGLKLLVRKGSELVFEKEVEPYRDLQDVSGLLPGEEYEVQVVVFYGNGTVQGTRQVVMRTENDNLLRVVFIISCVTFMVLTILTTVTRKIRKILDIKVETPLLLTAAVNSTTIEARQRLDDFKRDGECSVHSFQCSYGNEILDAKQVHVGRPPAEIEFQQNFRCFLRLGGDLDEKYCEFTPISQCDKSADYHLTVEDEGYDSPCVLKKKNGSYSYSSEYSNNCYFPPDDGVILRLDGNNSIGSMTQRFTVNHDFVKVLDVPKPELLDITSDCVDIRINLSNLKYVYREVESQFNISSKYGYKESSIVNHSYVVNYTIEGLYPFTEYKLGVRHRVISRGSRHFEEEYWSDWNWSSFRTNARKPDRAPRTLPGSYSFRNQRNDRSTLVVYWERLEEYEWNGSGFRYNVSAMTETGQMYYPRDVYESNEVATFEDLKIDHYWILVSCYNDEGSAQNTSIMEVFPPKNDLKPIIKKVESNGIDYTVSWYAPAIKSGISNYTVMYCNQPHSSSCKDSIHFLTVPSTQTTINVTSPTEQLNFGVAANYQNHSSDFSWQQCLVSPTANIGSPQFELCNITDTSFDIRMTTPCSSKSFYELLHVYVLTNGTEIRNEPFEQPKDRVWIEGLNPSTNYTVKVVAKDENGTSYVTSDTVQTASIYTKLQLTYFFSIVILAASALIMLTARKLNQIRNINVELPPALKTLLGEEEGDDYKMIIPSSLESMERTPRLYVDLPSGGYNNAPMIIPEEEEFGEVNEIDPEQSPEVSQDSASKEDLTVAASTVPVEFSVRSSVPSKVQANGYVLAAQFMTPKERQTPQLPPNLTNGSSSGYVMFK